MSSVGVILNLQYMCPTFSILTCFSRVQSVCTLVVCYSQHGFCRHFEFRRGWTWRYIYVYVHEISSVAFLKWGWCTIMDHFNTTQKLLLQHKKNLKNAARLGMKLIEAEVPKSSGLLLCQYCMWKTGRMVSLGWNTLLGFCKDWFSIYMK